MFRAAHMYAFVYLSGLLSMDAIYDLPILLKDCGVAINDPECTRLLVDAHVHYEYSMPHVVASHIIPCCVLVALSGTISNAFTRRSGLSLFVLLMTVVGAAVYIKFEPAAEKVLPFIPRGSLGVQEMRATIPAVSLQHVCLLAAILLAVVLLEIDNLVQTAFEEDRQPNKKTA